MPVTGNNIFLLEAIAYRVTLADPDEIGNTCPLCVCFRFPGLVDMEICDSEFCFDKGQSNDGIDVRMSKGKSCLFTVDAAELCRVARDFCAAITVYRKVANIGNSGSTGTRLLAQTRLEFDEDFIDIILEPDQQDRTRELKKVLPLYKSGRTKPIGTLCVKVRLTSHGDLLVTQFEQIADGYQYKDKTEYSPTNAKGSKSCLLKKKHSKKCCAKNKARMIERDIKSRGENCEQDLNRMKCVLNVMELMRDMFTKATVDNSRRTDSDDRVNDGDSAVHGDCMFDPECPLADCPFRADEPTGAFIDRLIDRDGRRVHTAASSITKRQLATDKSKPPRSVATAIVDDADMFTVRVGRVDPCRVKMVPRRDGTTQYLQTDIPAEFLPAAVKPPKSRSKAKSKKSKKPKK